MLSFLKNIRLQNRSMTSLIHSVSNVKTPIQTLAGKVKSSRFIKQTVLGTITFFGITIIYHKIAKKNAIDNNKNQNKTNRLPLDYSILANGTPEEINTMADSYGADFKTIIETSKTCRGNNPLHLASQNNSFDSIMALITHPNLYDKLDMLCSEANKEGKQAISLLEQNKKIPTNSVEHTYLFKTMFNMFSLTTDFLRPLSDTINVDELFSNRYKNIDRKSKLGQNLEIASNAINYARKIIQKSPSHIAACEPIDKAIESQQTLNTIRQQQNYRKFLSASWGNAFLIKNINEQHIGNCHEFSEIVKDFFAKNNKTNISCEIFHIENGDHVFNVIGRRKDSNPNDHTTWGDEAIVADAWGLDVFLAKEIPNRLQNFYKLKDKDFQNKYFTGPINPHFHKIALFKAIRVRIRDTIIFEGNSIFP